VIGGFFERRRCVGERGAAVLSVTLFAGLSWREEVRPYWKTSLCVT
jgi:hypothetical protein